MFSGEQRKATACNGLSKNHNRKKKDYFHEILPFWCLFFNYLQKNEMRLSDSLQSSLSAQILSTLINAVCLNDVQMMFIIVTLPSCIGSSQRVMKSMSSFNTKTIPVLRHINKSWLKTLIFSDNAFQGPCSGFSIFLVISQNYRLMKIRSKIPMVNSGSMPTAKMGIFVMIVNSIAKSPILDVSGVSGYIIVIIWCYSLMAGNF